jgi:hypothetical protein
MGPRSRRGLIERQPGAGTVCAAKEVICVRKLLLAAILATSAMLAFVVTASASGVPPCC